MAKNQQQLKEEETKRLIQFVDDNSLWIDNINIELYIFPAFKNRFEELNLTRKDFIHISFRYRSGQYIEPTVSLL